MTWLGQFSPTQPGLGKRIGTTGKYGPVQLRYLLGYVGSSPTFPTMKMKWKVGTDITDFEHTFEVPDVDWDAFSDPQRTHVLQQERHRAVKLLAQQLQDLMVLEPVDLGEEQEGPDTEDTDG